MTNEHDSTRQNAGDEAFDAPRQDQHVDADLGDPGARPTSPTRGAASEAAARAAYADAGKSAPVADPAEGGATAADPDALRAEATEEARTSDLSVDDILGAEQTPAAAAGSDAQLAAERLADYQRLNAEYVNYKRRVDRERAEDRNRVLGSFIESLLPVLDEIHLAREHGELGENTPFAKIAAKLEGILGKHGVETFGQVGETFDPMVHEALMHTTAELPEGTTDTTVVMVMQPGYRIGERVVRPARVSVADPA